jgi:hypothetical protein
MKKVIRTVAFLGLLCGTALVVEDKADACDSYSQDQNTGNCTCRYFQVAGYETCTQVGNACILYNPGCGDGPGIILP